MVTVKRVFSSIVLLLIAFVSLSTFPLKAASPIGTSFNFSIETKMGDQDAIVTDLGSKTYGSTVTVDAGSLASTGYTFVTYIVNGKVESTLPANNSFTVTSDLDVNAFYKPNGSVMVAFMDSNQDMLSVQYISSGADATAPSTTGLTKPGLVVSSTTPWSGDYTGVTEDTVLWVVYENAGTETYSLTVNNGTADDTSYAYNEVATVTASGTGTFQYWYMDGNIVSLQQTYSFTVLDNKEITAVYTGEETGPTSEALFLALSDPYAIKTSYSTYVGQFYLPTGHEMVEFGLIASDTPGDITLATSGVEKIRSDKFNPSTGEFVRSLLDSTYSSKNIRAYMITTDGVDFTETYSFVNENLFISEYGEGSGNNKWIEIYNPNDYAVDLSNYSLLLFSNGSPTGGSSPDFTGVTIASKDVLVIFNSGSVSSIIDEGDISSTVTYFNGDDALALYKDGYVLDQFGVIGTDPGTNWPVGTDSTLDHTLVRKSTITSPNPIWNADTWDAYDQDTFNYIGSHNPTSPTTITITGETTVMVGATINLSVSYDPVNSINGVTWSSSNEAIATVDSNGVVTGVATGTVTITATSTADTNVSDTHSVEVTAPVTYTVTYMSDGSQFTEQTGILSGSTTTAPDPAPEKTGYIFGGWFTDDTTFLNEFDFATTITEDTTLYAKWIETGSEVLAYSTTFESIEGFTTSTTYNNTAEKLWGPEGNKWATYYGTPSTTSPIEGLISMQNRWYSSAPSNLGYIRTDFSVSNVTKVVFNASSTSTIDVEVSYSTDGGATWVEAQIFDLTTTSTQYTYNINATGNVLIKFQITFTTTPANGARLYLDEIEIYNNPE